MPTLTSEQCRSRFAGSPVARLATVSGGGQPHLVPFTFAVLGYDPDVFVTAVDRKPKSGRRLRRLDNIRDNARISALVDSYDPDWSTLWWVRADGVAEIREQPDEEAVEALRAKYPQYRDADPFGTLIVLRIRRWSGWTAA
ncbi:TIGR03668 family PPOX class F420-dependent oxidoreductase [Actinoalloteichus spitiensis]|uniref:TIGR03668 family PPOX class F420-dependent oxidoreductase n=1 Tax=Actinoalloteichus spitiensis TaxID=252394 RepID=UPI000369174B|nr:TIGR03668 family PPOX class F420-dependent oxidoreductase [Actinoalloteichus spitiensis]